MIHSNQPKPVIILLVMMLLLISVTDGSEQEKTLDILNQKVSSMNITSQNFNEVLGELADAYHVPIGVEVPTKIDSTAKTYELPISIKDGNVKQVLDAVISVAPYYKWEENSGVINLSPSINNEAVLNIVVEDFQVNNLSTDEISKAITKSPEVKAKLAEMGLSRNDTDVIHSGEPGERKRLSFHLHHVTVRDILNYIIRTTNNKFWVVYRLGPHQEYITIRIW